MKPGYLTTEFWMTLAANGIGLLILLGWIGPDQSDVFKGLATQIITGVFATATLVMSIYSRLSQKSEALKLEQEQTKLVTAIESSGALKFSRAREVAMDEYIQNANAANKV